MSSAKSVNWDELTNPIRKWYLDEGKSASEVVRLVSQIFHVTITIRQLKWKFGRLKNIKKNEWRDAIREIRQRMARGQPYAVYLHGRRLGQPRIDLAMRRYKGDFLSNSMRPSNEEPRSNRIQVRTPPPDKTVNDPSYTDMTNLESAEPDALLVSQNIGEEQISSMVTRDGLHAAMVTANHDINLDAGVASNDFHEQGIYDMASYESWNFPDARDYTSETQTFRLPPILSLDHRNASHRFSPSRVLDHSSFSISSSFPTCSYSGSPLHLDVIATTFWDQPAVKRYLPQLSKNSCSLDAALVLMNRARDVVGYSYSLHWDPVTFVQYALQVVSETIPGALSDVNIHCLDGISWRNENLYNIFTLLVFFCANQHMSITRLKLAIEWLMKCRLTDKLSRFLQDTSDLPDVISFKRELFEIFSPRTIMMQGERSAESLWRAYPAECMMLLYTADERTMSHSLGANLLLFGIIIVYQEAVRYLVPKFGLSTSYEGLEKKDIPIVRAAAISEELVQIFVSAGMDLNVRISCSGQVAETPLFFAISITSDFAVKNLLAHGAIINPDWEFRGETLLNHSRKWLSSDTHVLLLAAMGIEDISSRAVVDAASKGRTRLAKWLYEHPRAGYQLLEHSLYDAITWHEAASVGTLLRHGVNPNTKNYLQQVMTSDGAQSNESPQEEVCPLLIALQKSSKYIPGDEDHVVSVPAEPLLPIIQLLLRAGAQLCPQTLTPQGLKKHNLKITPLVGDILHSGGLDIRPILGEMLVTAVQYKDSAVHCAKLLDMGAPIDAYGADGLSALQDAAGRSLWLTQYLVYNGASVKLPAFSNGGLTALQNAARYNQFDIIDFLIDEGADPGAPRARHRGLTALEALAKGRPRRFIDTDKDRWLETFAKIRSFSVPVSHPNEEPSSLLHDIVNRQQYEALEMVLQAKPSLEDRVEITQADEKTYMPTPLQYAASRLDIKAMRLLIDYGAAVNAHPAGPRGLTALQSAALTRRTFYDKVSEHDRQIKVVELLLGKDAEVNAPAGESFGRTALQAVLSAPQEILNLALVRLLLNHGADVNAPPSPNGGVTALQAAAIAGNLVAANMLLTNKADVNAPAAASDGRTAVEGAAEHGRLEMLRLLLRHGARPDSPGGFQKAINLAKKNEQYGTAKLLEDYNKLFQHAIGLSPHQPMSGLEDGVIEYFTGDQADMGPIKNGFSPPSPLLRGMANADDVSVGSSPFDFEFLYES